MTSPAASPSVVPAQLGFLAIYNPSLGMTDDTIDDQIVYYASVATQSHSGRRRRRTKSRPLDATPQEERNKRLRQIGLAQGMVDFSRSFSGDQPVDTVETEKSRVVLHELEPGWWILASVDLTRLPSSPPKAKAPSTSSSGAGSTAATATENGVDYSSREVKPAALLLQDLLKAHAGFLLHHEASLTSLFIRINRSKFVALLTRYWDAVLSTWNVMLHGNPIANVFGGIRVAASGELGVGVGEEERGSGEREVLEGLVGRIEGLVDLVVSKFGTCDPDAAPEVGSGSNSSSPQDSWLGTGAEPGAEDGAIFLGTGAVSRRSLRDITNWMEDIYSWGDVAYGVRDNPSSTRRARVRRKPSSGNLPPQEPPQEPIMLPPTPVTELARRAKQPPPPSTTPTTTQGTTSPKKTQSPATQAESVRPATERDSEGTGMNNFVDYLKLGYGKYWSIGGSPSNGSEDQTNNAPPVRSGRRSRRASAASPDGSAGRYIIGLLGDVEEPATISDDETPGTGSDKADEGDRNVRTMVRTVVVELEASSGATNSDSPIRRALGSRRSSSLAREAATAATVGTPATPPKPEEDGAAAAAAAAELGSNSNRPPLFDSQDNYKAKKLRVVVYVNRPFIFTFLFRLGTDSLAFDGLYKSLHHQLAPLRRPLATSTAYRPGRPDVGPAAAEVFDLVWDPEALTIHSTLPSIPDPGGLAIAGVPAGVVGVGVTSSSLQKPVWTRVEALNTHSQMLNMFLATRTDASELERTCKTSRGWWVVWNRVTRREPALADGGGDDRPELDNGEDDVDRFSDGFGGGGGGSDDGQVAKTWMQQQLVVSKEIFLVRKASDHGGGGGGGGVAGALRSVSASYAGVGSGGGGSDEGGGRGGAGWAEGASRLAQGIGVDTRKYIEGLLSLNR